MLINDQIKVATGLFASLPMEQGTHHYFEAIYLINVQSMYEKVFFIKSLKQQPYDAGPVPINADQNPDVDVLGWLGAEDLAGLNFNGVRDENEPVAAPVIGILNYPKSRVFFIGDMNGIEIQGQPFIDNLIQWMGHCF
jgi:hypothetical protein